MRYESEVKGEKRCALSIGAYVVCMTYSLCIDAFSHKFSTIVLRVPGSTRSSSKNLFPYDSTRRYQVLVLVRKKTESSFFLWSRLCPHVSTNPTPNHNRECDAPRTTTYGGRFLPLLPVVVHRACQCYSVLECQYCS